MREILRLAILPAYVLLCLVLAGSAQGVWTNAAVQVLGVAMIAWAFLARCDIRLLGPARSVAVLTGLTALLIGLQLIPLPPAIWTALPGRDFVSAGFRLMEMQLPWLPLSLTPYDTITTLPTLIPPIAVLSTMLLLGAYRASWLAVAVLFATLVGVLIGALQVSSADPLSSPWYFYEQTNWGVAVGFFANSNHMAALLVVSVPILFALVRDLRDRSENAKSGSAILVLAAAGAVVLVMGILLNGSLAVLLLGPPVLVLSALILFQGRMKLRGLIGGLAAFWAAASLGLYMSPLVDPLAGDNAVSIAERQVIWSNTATAIPDFMPVGSGLSSFSEIYSQYEDPSAITRTYTSHAHNDYLEIMLETGVPGALLLIAFILWWASRAGSIWLSPSADPYAHAATIASAALLLHSLVEYPLRTAALSAVMAVCVAIMGRPSPQKPGASADLWATRHARI